MSDWKSTLAAIAPGIATALGGPLAGMAVNVATSALGIEPTEAALEAAVTNGNPDALLKLKEAENRFKLEEKRLGVQDRDSARGLAKAKGVLPQVILSTVYTIGYFWLMKVLIVDGVEIAESVEPLVLGLIGVMSAAQVQIMNFWFGSSAGSKAKDSK